MNEPRKEHVFAGRLVMLGFGCIGQGALPLLLRHIEMSADQVLIVSADDAGAAIAASHGVHRLCMPVTAENLHHVLGPLLGVGDFLLNLSVDVSSVALIRLCRERGALYLDTCIEPWKGGYVDHLQPPGERTNYALREAALALRSPGRNAPTALLTHGANPGLVSHFVKQALLDLIDSSGGCFGRPTSREHWARLANCLNVQVIHVAERDSQCGAVRKQPGEFVNTWSVDGFASEACQPAELGWGSHEQHCPVDAQQHESGSRASIYLLRPGATTWVRSWTPLGGAQHALLITHGESISIADHLTLGDPARPDYRPTVHYAYRPCDDALLSLLELEERNWRLQERKRVLKDEIEDGIDELGVLLMGHSRGAYWYGSQLSSRQARELCPFNSATSLQVTAAVMAGVVWVMKNPARDVVEPDDLPFDEIIERCRPYLGKLVGVFSHWTPLDGRAALFPQDVDTSSPWQFKNFRVD